MGKAGGQKLKLLRVYQILLKKSDENHPLNASDLVNALKEYEIVAERKSVYDDIEVLIEAGVDLIKTGKGYYIGSRNFELPELKLLADAVGASKFISQKKSKELIKKLEELASENQAKQLSRQVIVPDRVKTDNEKIFYTIDTIYQSIDEDRQLSFQYEEWNVNKQKVLRHQGMEYLVSPAFLIRNDENYYLVAYDEQSQLIKHYRVDKIVNASIREERRSGVAARTALLPEEYAKHHVSMFSGATTTVTIKCQRSLVGVLLDKFGADISIRTDGENYIRARIPVAVSPQFFGWVTGIKATIVAPEESKEAFRTYISDILEL